MNRLVRASILAVSLAAATSAQQAAPADPFAVVAADKREQLRADMRRAVDMQKRGRWKQFSAVYDNDYPTLKGKPSLLDNAANGPRLEEFAPFKVFWREHQQAWQITGCAAFDEPNSSSGLGFESAMTIRYVDGSARFLPVMMIGTDQDGIRRCRFIRRH